MLNRWLVASMASMMMCGGMVANAQASVRFAVFSDPHLFDPALGTEGEAFEAYLAQDRKLIRESEALTKSVVAELIKNHQSEPLDFILVSGDLTKDGERASHEKFAGYLAQLEAAGIPVYVIPGNHDVNNPHAMSFDGATATPVENVTPAQFSSVYNQFGYGEAKAIDANSLSYAVEPVPGLVLLGLDSCKYADNVAKGYPVTSGAYSAATQTWIVDQIAAARANGKQVIAMQHHGILEHYTGQSQAFTEYVIDDWQNVSESLAKAGLGLMFTGHYHANDITEKTWADTGDKLYDVETGSLVTAPCPYRIVTLHGNNAAQIETKKVQEIDYDTNGVAFPEYAQQFLYEGLMGIAQYTLKEQYKLDDAIVAALAPLVADAFEAHYAGDEKMDATTKTTIDTYLAGSDYTTQLLKKTLYSLWTDLAPADNRALLSLNPAINLSPLGTYNSGHFNEGAAEIVAYDSSSKRLFVSNAKLNTLDVLDVSNPATPSLSTTIDLAPYGAGVNSVAVKNGIVAVAVEANPKQDPGQVVFFDTNGTYRNKVQVGALPDMLTFTPDGSRIVVANEGEPNADYTVDPEGSVSIIDITRNLSRIKVRTADFKLFNNQKTQLQAQGIRVFGRNATVAQDFEPEYITISADSRTAYVTLQENNAIARIDLQAGRVVEVTPMGVKDLGLEKNALDVTDKDKAINFVTAENLFGLYLPDAIGSYLVNGRQYLVTANEGDSRDYETFTEEARVKDLTLDSTAFPDATAFKKDKAFGRLKVTNTLGDTDGDGDYDQLFAFGGRSFTIMETTRSGLVQVFDSGSQLEAITADILPTAFNSSNDKNNTFDDRSDDKGPEPEGLAIGTINGRVYLFLGLERVGGIMVYDITNAQNPDFVQYINNRNFSGDPAAGTAGDLAPEGLTFIPASQSPSGKNMLAVANEVSGTTTLYQIDVQ